MTNKQTRLKVDIEKKIGRSLKSPADFDYLSLKINESKAENISASTLKRIWNYVSTEHTTRHSTLSVLARFLGYMDWDDYCTALLSSKTEEESGFLASQQILATDLTVGDIIEFRWNPNRDCTALYLGKNRFKVLAASNAKITAGNTFSALSFNLHHPLYITDLCQEGKISKTYVAGSKSGLSHISRLS